MTRQNNHHMRKIKLKSTLAFTLLETAIAICIATSVIVSSLYAFHRGMSLIQTARDTNIASGYLTGVCEYIRHKADSTGNVPSAQTISDEYILPDCFTLDKNPPETQNATQGVVAVEVIVGWQEESNRQREIPISMHIAKRQKA
jgi:hypothetical protein